MHDAFDRSRTGAKDNVDNIWHNSPWGIENGSIQKSQGKPKKFRSHINQRK
jgi:hypothetical protein